jgi:hypothetical protein
VARRRLTIKRIDPWSVLKFAAVVNIALLGVGLLVVGVIFFMIDRLGLIDQVCTIALDVGFTDCGLNIGNLFRAIALLGLLGVIILTAVAVFLSFLHNLIADLTGGLTLSVLDDGPPAARPANATAARTYTGSTPARAEPTPGPSTNSTPRPSADRTTSPPVPPLRREERTGRDAGVPADDGDPTARWSRDDDELFRGR